MQYKSEVENIKCGGCINSIRKALLELEGVGAVHIDAASETITIDGIVDYEVIENTLSNLGYPPKGKNNLGHKAKSFVSCAIGKLS